MHYYVASKYFSQIIFIFNFIIYTRQPIYLPINSKLHQSPYNEMDIIQK